MPKTSIQKGLTGKASEQRKMVPVESIPLPPALKGNKVAAAEWTEKVAKLTELGALNGLDTNMLQVWCLTWAAYLAEQSSPDQDGKQLARLSKLEDRLGRTAAHFGFSPKARASLGIDTRKTAGGSDRFKLPPQGGQP